MAGDDRVFEGTDRPSFIYQWQAESGFFLHAVLPHAVQLEAHSGDRVADVLATMPADTALFAFHLNCTVTARFPRERDQLVATLTERGIRVLNANVTDISKRTVQRTCARLGLNTTLATPDGDADELVIVKSDLNFGGDSEWAFSDEERTELGIPKGSDIIWTSSHYRVVPRRDVEPAWWTDQRLICERFISNRQERWYRAFLFMDRLAVCELSCPHAIKKVGDSVVSRILTVADPQSSRLVHDIERFVRAFGLDFGTIDAVVDDAGEHYIIDVNTTPAYTHPIPGVVEHMGNGLAARPLRGTAS